MFIAISIGLGILLLLCSLVICQKLITIINDRDLKWPWRILFCLICIFIVGYIVTLYLLNLTMDYAILHPVIAGILFLGAIFVVLVVTMNYRLIGRLNNHNREISEKNSTLEKLTEQMQKHEEVLEQVRKQLEHKNNELEETLDSFYTARIGILKDLSDGKVEEENQKIKARLAVLKEGSEPTGPEKP